MDGSRSVANFDFLVTPLSADLAPPAHGDVAGEARAAFGDALDANAFLHAPHPELGGLTPLEAAITAGGAARVQRLLHALTHGLPV
jgi:uncharacterized protein (DUF2384 family)